MVDHVSLGTKALSLLRNDTFQVSLVNSHLRQCVPIQPIFAQDGP